MTAKGERMDGNYNSKQHEDIKESSRKGDVLVGPDLNSSRTPLDKKLYRQIILKENGLRVLLISDTVAMGQQQVFIDDDYDDDDEDVSNDDNDGDNHSNDNEEEEEEEEDGLRKAAAAVVVRAGSYYDPPEAQGMAHFLEHMLFMGTEKYPSENAYDAFLNKNGGSDNAYTEMEYTLYHLEIVQEKFFEALDMLAQFFGGHPLLKSDAVERELNAIESEFELSRNSDECRLQQTHCHTSSSHTTTDGKQSSSSPNNNRPRRHPFTNFSWGNIHSLKTVPESNGVNVLEKLRQFYDQYYYAQNMSLVVIGAFTLDQLEQQVLKCFQIVPSLPRYIPTNNNNNNLPSSSLGNIERINAKTWDVSIINDPIANLGQPFSKASLQKIYRIIPVKERHTLTITWQVPSQKQNWKSKPCDYLAHLLGHEASGSLLSLLKEKLWVNGCYAGVGSGGYENASSHALFNINFTLTEEGVSHWEDIITHVYSYIGMIRFYCRTDDDGGGGGGGLPMWIHEELRLTQEAAYLYQDEKTPVSLVEDIAEVLAVHEQLPPERLLDGNSLLFEYNQNLIQDIVDNYLTPSNSRVDLMSSTFGCASDYDVKHSSDYENSSNINSNNICSFSSPPTFTDNNDNNHQFSPNSTLIPQTEEYFGTQYWCHDIHADTMQKWIQASETNLPSSLIGLPPKNPFIPTQFALKPLPEDDTHHPLLNCSLKLCITVGKKKSWFPATVVKYDRTKSKILLSYEDEDEKWHILDNVNAFCGDDNKSTVTLSTEGTLDKKKIRFKVVAVPKEGEGAVLKYGDDCDYDVEEGLSFPPIPPALAKSRLPQLTINTKKLKLWHLQDRKFKRPIAELRLKIVCADANKTPLHRACAELFSMLCSDIVTEVSYLANVCELAYSLSTTDFGFNLRVHGFDHKLQDLLQELLNVFFSFQNIQTLPEKVKPGRFEACLESHMRKLMNSGMSASNLSTSIRLGCIRPTLWTAYSKATAMENITTQRFCEIVSILLSKITIEGLYHGNVDREDAKMAASLIDKMLISSEGFPSKKHPQQLVTSLPLKSECSMLILPSINPNDNNNAIERYFQLGKDDVKKRVMIDLLSQILDEPFYDQLRTKDQFGYSVSCAPRWSFGIMGMSFRVVSSSKSATEIVNRIEKFLGEIRSELVDMKVETFLENITGLAKNKLEMFNCLAEESGFFWSEIVEKRYEWESYRNEAIALRSVTKEDVIKAFDDWFSPICEKGLKRKHRQLIVQVIGNGEGGLSEGRPPIEPQHVRFEIDKAITDFHKNTAKSTWGKVF